MIGELLTHLIIKEYFNDFDIAFPFFNKEDRDVKKGFDVIIVNKLDYSRWVTEVK